MAALPAVSTQKQKQRQDRIPAMSAVVCIIWSIVFSFKPDLLAALTIWPFWVIGGIGLLPVAMSFRRARAKVRLAVIGMWLVAWTVFGDEALPLARTLIPKPNRASIRVVSLNAAGLSEAAGEVVHARPDVVLIQESMGEPSLETLRRTLGTDWSLLAGTDTSILVRGEIAAVALPPFTLDFIAGWASFPGRALIVSIRLRPPVFRLDYWNPSCWRAYA
ncbi:MAG: hypothetical protein M3R13_10565, partial [Armatimonadota bacterium]|nr:hypothetical protein [Armatimonadota bacterium]